MTAGPGYRAWREARGYGTPASADDMDAPTGAAHNLQDIDPRAQTAFHANSAAEADMLAALSSFRYLIYQHDDDAARKAGNLLVARIKELHRTARTLLNATRPPVMPVSSRPRSGEEQ